MRANVWLLGCAALVLGAGGPAHGEPVPTACGKPGLRPCPMQAFMRESVSAPLASNNGAALAVALERVAAAKPDADWLSWEQYALEGAAAAQRGDLRAARVACTGCHASYRELYRGKHRARAVR